MLSKAPTTSTSWVMPGAHCPQRLRGCVTDLVSGQMRPSRRYRPAGFGGQSSSSRMSLGPGTKHRSLDAPDVEHAHTKQDSLHPGSHSQEASLGRWGVLAVLVITFYLWRTLAPGRSLRPSDSTRETLAAAVAARKKAISELATLRQFSQCIQCEGRCSCCQGVKLFAIADWCNEGD